MFQQGGNTNLDVNPNNEFNNNEVNIENNNQNQDFNNEKFTSKKNANKTNTFKRKKDKDVNQKSGDLNNMDQSEYGKIKNDEMINPLDNIRTPSFFRVHITGYIESGSVSD